jgi:hypothetical protein
LLASIILSGLSISAQKIIENPEFSAKTANYVKITRIELSDTITKIDFEVHYFPKWWISISSPQTYIQNSNGGKKLYVQKAEGIKLNERHWTPASGVNIYSLYFPAIGKEVEKIDYLEESWKIFDIELNETEITHFIPEEIQGNWLRTDGSNEWMYGIYDDKVIYQSIVWDKVLLNKKGKNYELSLKKGDKQENIFIKVKKDNLLIGNSPEIWSYSARIKPAILTMLSKTMRNIPCLSLSLIRLCTKVLLRVIIPKWVRQEWLM